MIDYQVVINLVCYVIAISFPIALVFMICQKILGTFMRVIWGKDITF